MARLHVCGQATIASVKVSAVRQWIFQIGNQMGATEKTVVNPVACQKRVTRVSRSSLFQRRRR